MSDGLLTRQDQGAFSPASDFRRESTAVQIISLERFLNLLEQYDGTKRAFSETVSAALEYLRLSPNVLAVDCETAPITIVRWARGAAPSALARNGAIACLRKVVQRQLDIERARLQSN